MTKSVFVSKSSNVPQFGEQETTLCFGESTQPRLPIYGYFRDYLSRVVLEQSTQVDLTECQKGTFAGNLMAVCSKLIPLNGVEITANDPSWNNRLTGLRLAQNPLSVFVSEPVSSYIVDTIKTIPFPSNLRDLASTPLLTDESVDLRTAKRIISFILPGALNSKIKRKIIGFKKLKKGWDGYEAQEISDEAILRALDLVNNLYMFLRREKINPRSVFIAPLANGGIQLDIDTPRVEMEIEIDPSPDGKVSYLVEWLGENRFKRFQEGVMVSFEDLFDLIK